LERQGYTREMHERGESKVAARGHSHDAKWTEFKKLDGHNFVPGFDQLPVKTKTTIAEQWKLGFMTPRPHGDEPVRPKNKNKRDFDRWEKRRKKWLDKEAAWQDETRKDRGQARDLFLKFMDEHMAGMTKDNWARYKDDYRTMFGSEKA
jgi:hypothetical protein